MSNIPPLNILANMVALNTAALKMPRLNTPRRLPDVD